MKTTTKILIVVGLIFIGGVILLFSWVTKITVSPPPPTPQPIRYILNNGLCEKLSNTQTDSLCSDGKAILASDILALFENKFIPNETTQDDVINLLGMAGLEEINPFYMYTSYHQFDLTGTGVNRIVIWSDHKHIVKSVVFIHPNVFTPLSQETVTDLCNRLNSANSSPCIKNNPVYAQDFYPAIREIFLDKLDTEKLFSLLESYSYIETPNNYKWFFQFSDSPNSRILFYFNENKKLENTAFVSVFAPTPLDAEVLADLCHNISIETEKCKSTAQIYTTDLIREIRAAFPIGTTTYEDVQGAIGKYQYGFTYPVRGANGNEVTLSWYDFVGDNFTRIRFDFDTDFIVRQIYFFSGGS
jgi:hypothetical protein